LLHVKREKKEGTGGKRRQLSVARKKKTGRVSREGGKKKKAEKGKDKFIP